MGLSDRVTQLLEAWLGIGEKVSQSYPPVKISDGTDSVDVIPTNGNNGLVVISPNHISANNSTTDLLDANDVYLGISEDTLNYSDIKVSIFSDVASKTDGLEIQFSFDASTWYTTDTYTIVANTCKTFSLACIGRYFRIKYTNSSSAQTTFCLETRLCINTSKGSSHRIDDAISGEDDAELMKSVITGKRADGMFDNVSLTNGSNMKISLEELESNISSNSNKQLNVTIFDETGEAVGVNYGSIETITHAHKEVHAGGHYVAGHLFTGVANDATVDFRIVNGSTKELHVIITVICELKAYGVLYCDSTYTADGTVVPSYNNNQRSSNTSTATFYHTPTIDVLGPQCYPQYLIPAGVKSQAIGGTASNGQEIVIDADGDGIIRLQSKGGAGTSNDIQVLLEWYEETI